MNRQDFITRYAANMKAHCDSGKAIYINPTDGWEGLAKRMVDGILAGRAHISNQAKKTVKQCGGKPTNAGVVEFLKNLPLGAVTTRQCIIPAGREVELVDVGDGFYLILRAQTDTGELKSTGSMTLFLVEGDFKLK